MKQLLAAATLSGLLISGCTPLPTPLPPASPSASPTPPPVVVPTVSSQICSRLLVDDPSLVLKRDEEVPQAPNSFAVVDGQVIINDYLHDVFATYKENRQTAKSSKPSIISDFVVRNNFYYLLRPNYDATLYTVNIYNHTNKGLKKVREIKLPETPVGEAGYDRLYFEGPNLNR